METVHDTYLSHLPLVASDALVFWEYC